MVNGLPGNVATIMAAAVLKDPRFELVPHSLTGPDIDLPRVQVEGPEGRVDVELIRPQVRDEKIAQILSQYPGAMAIDYTHPSAVTGNVQFYATQGIPFVMGTTGGNPGELEALVNQGNTPAVIAPNMAKQIVGFQAMMDHAAQNFPGLFEGYTLEIKESHQKGKADTSGTARAMVGYFNQLGVDFSVKDIQQERDPATQEKEWNIPKEHLGGHGWHTYTLTAPDGSSLFEFKHNINGRDIYVAGTFDALIFLRDKITKNGPRGKMYSMLDVMNDK